MWGINSLLMKDRNQSAAAGAARGLFVHHGSPGVPAGCEVADPIGVGDGDEDHFGELQAFPVFADLFDHGGQVEEMAITVQCINNGVPSFIEIGVIVAGWQVDHDLSLFVEDIGIKLQGFSDDYVGIGCLSAGGEEDQEKWEEKDVPHMLCLYKISIYHFWLGPNVMKRAKNVIKQRNFRVCDCVLIG